MGRTHFINAGLFLIGTSLVMSLTDSVWATILTAVVISVGWEAYQYGYRTQRNIPTYIDQIIKDIGSMWFGSFIGILLTHAFVHWIPEC